MNKKLKAVFIVILISISLFSTGRPNVIDELQLITIVGFDKVEGDKFKGTATLTSYSLSEEMNTATLSAVSTSTRKIRMKLNAKSSRPIHGGKISAIVIQDELAKEGTFDLLDTYYRDPTIALKAFLCVVKGETADMLAIQSPLHTEIGTYLSDMLQHNIDYENIPVSNMHLFMRSYYEEGIDPVMPILSYSDSTLQIDGIALFKDDQFMYELDLRESFFLKLIKDGYQSGGVIEVAVDDDKETAVLRDLRSDSDVGVDIENNRITIDLKLKARISEYSGGLITEEKIEALAKEADHVIEEGIEKIIKKMQETNIDSFGLGVREIDRRGLTKEEWFDIYQQLETSVHVETKIVESGVTQ